MEPTILKALIALAPVIVCLIAFERLDAFKLVSLGEILALLAGGATLTALGYFANGGVLDEFPVKFNDHARYIAPVIEEALKSALIVGLFAFNRIGYLIDAAIAGFTIGAGFAMAENVFYLHEFFHASIGVWIVRGLGTALMHGGATAIMSVMSLMLYAPRLRAGIDRFRLNLLLFAPGLAIAILLHMGFNHFPQQPLEAMFVALVSTPLGLFGLFAVGESYAHRWLAEDRQAHTELLRSIVDGTFDRTDAGVALDGLVQRLEGDVAANLHDYVRLNAELVVRAEATLLAAEEHRTLVRDMDVHADFRRLHALERTLGRSLVMAARQHIRFSRDDLWKMHELETIDARRSLGERLRG